MKESRVTLKQIERVLVKQIDIPMIAAKLKTLGFGTQLKLVKPGKDTPRYIDCKDGTVFDTMWGIYRVKLPHTDLPNIFKTGAPWGEMKQACKELNFAGHNDWVLPKPLWEYSLVENKASGPCIDTNMFPDTKASYYWTDEEVAHNPDYARVVGFGSGYAGYGHKGNGNYARPVRLSQ